jgi:hypothetical protein
MATDPTGARIRDVTTVFQAPRVPIKQLPGANGGADAGVDNAGDGSRLTLEGWNAYVGAPGRPS